MQTAGSHAKFCSQDPYIAILQVDLVARIIFNFDLIIFFIFEPTFFINLIFLNPFFMANTYHQLYVQTVFAVKYRATVLKPEWRKEFFSVIGNQMNETGCKNFIVNGVEDHVHCFFRLLPSLAISDVMQKIKPNSSGWLNKQNLMKHHFAWQSGYGAFSYSRSHLNNVYQYILNQETHHKKITFRSEYVELLKSFALEYDEKYLFHDLI